MKLASRLGVFLIRIYQVIFSPLLGPAKCRFCPTCSEYAVEAVERYGLVYGSYLALRRLLRCGPWSKGGWDPVPGPDEVKRIRIGALQIYIRTSKG
jgi:putative membrane protein insertion efficiency factor